MQNILLYIFLLACFSSTAQYDFDRNDFFEISGNYATLTKSKTLVISSVERGDIEVENNGLKGYGFGIRYGKAITTFAHLTFGIAYAKRERPFNKIVETFEASDDYIYSYKIKSLSSTVFEFGPRIKILNTEGFELSLGGGGFAKLTPNSEDNFTGGYYYHGIVGVNFNQRIQLNAKYGYESTVGTIKYLSLPAEIAFHYKIY